MGKWSVRWTGELRARRSFEAAAKSFSLPCNAWLAGKPCPQAAVHVRRITFTCIVATPGIPQTRLRVIAKRGLRRSRVRVAGVAEDGRNRWPSADMQSTAGARR